MAGMVRDEEHEKHVARMYNELFLWLQKERDRRHCIALQEKIKQAQASGDEILLMELLAEKQNMRKKNDF